ncbi:uncharacterized protein B0T15DRAFT_174735 [Chaetomium strumarium]|uniref:Uncharacterized protein n=1 Tax=Chaetomium strumarium TaxID=1170767 RepID=A0AAJ0GWC7_9PEZI|nr:hypothetical protein B0T15DRAFT_174735 [Chaetomium strumarium]
MADHTVYLITGANRGIGLAITSLLLTRPNTTVIATSRKPLSLSAVGGANVHPTSKLVPVLLDEVDPAITSATLPARLTAEHGITHLDVVIANAGTSSAFEGVMSSSASTTGADPGKAMLRDFEVNAVGPARLFGALWPLLDSHRERADEDREGMRKVKKFVLMSSSLGSIGALEQESLPGVSYGMSKAAANWWAKKVSVELKGRLLVGIIHPGWVQTGLGQALASAVGFGEPPTTPEQSAKAVVEQIDNLTPEKSGQFLKYNGEQLPW